MIRTIIIPSSFTVSASIALARDNNTPLIINPETHQALICDVLLPGFICAYDPTRVSYMRRRLIDEYMVT